MKYLTPKEQNHVIENIQPEGVDISKLEESIKNFKQNELTLDFIHGLFDGDGSISVSLIKSPDLTQEQGEGKNKITLKTNFTIVQDVHNISLLYEIKKFFNDKGNIYELKNSENCLVYNTGSRSLLREVILPKMMGKESNELLNNSSMEEVKLPLIKYNKIYCTYKILEYGFVDLIENKEILNEFIKRSAGIFYSGKG